MRIKVEKIGSICVLRLSGKLTIGDGDRDLRESFRRLLDQGERRFIINMLRLSFVDSAGLGETVACKKRAAEKGAHVRLVVKPRGKPEEVFILTCLDRIFKMFPTEAEALASFAGLSEADSAGEGVGEPTVDGDDVARGIAKEIAGQKDSQVSHSLSRDE
jgi:anti-sigma B factor antagonist